MTIDLEKQILEQADKEDKQRRAEYARKLKEHLISMPKVLHDLIPAFENADVFAGITQQDLTYARAIGLMAEMADEDLALLRTHAFFLIDGVIRTDKGHNSRSTKLSYELTGFFKQKERTKEEQELYSLAFPVSKRGETLCTPLGAKVILNFLAVFGTEQFIEGNLRQRSEALFSLHKYAMMIPSKQVLDGPFPTVKSGFVDSSKQLFMDDGRLVLRKPVKPDVERKPNGQFAKGHHVPEEWKQQAEAEVAVGERKETVVKGRPYDQKTLRKKMLERNPVCPFTNISSPKFLRVSHIKPDSECEGGEGADPANILMLSILPDKLFDCEAVEGFQRVAFISFNDEGRVMRSTKVTNEELLALGLPKNWWTVSIAHLLQGGEGERRKRYLKWHRENMFYDNVIKKAKP